MIFLDTGFVYAFFNEDDANHERVSEVLDRMRGQRLSDLVLTTNHVVAETLTLCRYRGHRDPKVRHAVAVKAGRALFSGAFGRIHQATAHEESQAFAYFERHQDKQYSFVDCLSFVVMEAYRIQVAWTVDGDFAHRFKAIPGPAPR